jgi:CxxC motif-containing protein (DUF1111 family)
VLAAAVLWAAASISTVYGQAATEAPAGFDNLTNGFVPQATYDLDRDVFERIWSMAEGLGPVYNARGCVECHQNPVSAGISQVTNLRAGHFNGFSFVDHPGGSLISDRATNAAIQERLLGGNEVRSFRTSLNTLGDGFVECINSNTLLAISNGQPANMRGQLISVPVSEASNALRTGRFGWKDQHASLLSFTVDQLLNQIGITSPLQPVENTSIGRFVGFGSGFDPVPDPEDDGGTALAIVEYLRSTKVPPRDGALAATVDAQVGAQLFNAIGCAICHVRTITTAATGTIINGGQLTVPAALGNKIIHPLSDFLLHDVGTGDGIVQNGGQSTRNKMRTPALWGLRTRVRLMHDGNTVNRNEAILRHAGEASGVISNYNVLSSTQKNQLITFLNSL